MADGTLIFDTKLDNNGLNKGLNQTESAFQRTGGKAAAFGKAAAVAGVAAGAALVAVGKKSLELYSDYEQLKGGVETLFGSSSDTVLQYAQNAYKTAGMSANQYMETVTSFSASLLQSLGGNTEQAAKIGDMAIQDMSDNANKMGTDISRIQDAYQGFAKQNYTMLDNLKLGYGGTKTEMERLLADAEKLTGVHYDINNLSDVYNAIHAIQNEMGITGTTAKEASETIQGSVSMMKASWDNLLTGLGDPSADIDALVQNLITSIGTVAENVLPRIAMITQGLGQMITGLIPMIPGLMQQLLPQLITSLQGIIQSLAAILPGLMQIIIAVFPQLVAALIQVAPMIIQGVTQMIVMLAEALPQMLPMIIQAIIQLIPLLIDATIQIINALITALPAIIQALVTALPAILKVLIPAVLKLIPLMLLAGVKIIKALWDGIKQKAPELAAKLWAWAKTLPTKIKNGIGNLAHTGAEWIAKFRDSIKEKITDLAEKAWNWAKSIPKKIKNGLGSLKDIGRNFLKGLWDGIKEKWESFKNWIGEKAESIPNMFSNILGIASPSKVMAELGRWIPIGFAKGIDDNLKYIEEAMVGMGNVTIGNAPQPITSASGISAGIFARASNSHGAPFGGDTINNVEQTINFNQPVSTPSQTARVLREQAMYGLAGA